MIAWENAQKGESAASNLVGTPRGETNRQLWWECKVSFPFYSCLWCALWLYLSFQAIVERIFREYPEDIERISRGTDAIGLFPPSEKITFYNHFNIDTSGNQKRRNKSRWTETKFAPNQLALKQRRRKMMKRRNRIKRGGRQS